MSSLTPNAVTMNREILVFTETTVSKRLKQQHPTPEGMSFGMDLLPPRYNDCWQGLVCQLLPDLIVAEPAFQRLFTWNVMAAEHFILVNQGENPLLLSDEKSLDPYLFLLYHPLN